MSYSAAHPLALAGYQLRPGEQVRINPLRPPQVLEFSHGELQRLNGETHAFSVTGAQPSTPITITEIDPDRDMAGDARERGFRGIYSWRYRTASGSGEGSGALIGPDGSLQVVIPGYVFAYTPEPFWRIDNPLVWAAVGAPVALIGGAVWWTRRRVA